MALVDLMSLSNSKGKIGLSENRIEPIKPELIKAFSFWREYPDLFLDFLAGPNNPFKLFFYQRFFLRAVMRHRCAYATFPRA